MKLKGAGILFDRMCNKFQTSARTIDIFCDLMTTILQLDRCHEQTLLDTFITKKDNTSKLETQNAMKFSTQKRSKKREFLTP